MRLIPALVMVLSLFIALPASAAPVTIDDARAMAFDRGIVKIEEIELKRRKGIWEIEGRDARGNEIEMEVEAATGRIIKMRRD
ncbi:MAG: PepSY domain-containing protein [Alphaproteobacteria bacterium]|nr:PepSY domain-containing protein [Alphaproteobacteria bacterium]